MRYAVINTIIDTVGYEIAVKNGFDYLDGYCQAMYECDAIDILEGIDSDRQFKTKLMSFVWTFEIEPMFG